MIKDLEMGRLSWIIRVCGLNVITRVLISERGRRDGLGSVTGRCYTVGFGDGGRGHEPRNVGGFKT